MAQFDVYKNPSKQTRKLYPYLLDIQSSVISELATKIVVPLGKLEHFGSKGMQTLTPIIEHDGEQLIILTPQIASIPANILRSPIGSLEHCRDEIIGSLDFAITGV